MKMMTPSLHLKVQLTNCGNAMKIGNNDFNYKDILPVDHDIYSEWLNWNNSFQSCKAVLKRVMQDKETNIYFRLF